MRILIVEDEQELAESIAEGLRLNSYSVDICGNSEEALEVLLSVEFDLILLDLNLPGMDGLDVLRVIRREKPEMKVLILTARNSIADRVGGLDCGADDYLTKPFSFEELNARIRCLLRRKFIQEDTIQSSGEIVFDTLTRTARASGKLLYLTRKETALLEYFIFRADRLVTQEELIEHIWDSRVNDFSNSVRVHISSLRRKVRSALGYDPFRNRVGEGYLLQSEGNEH